MRKIDGWRTLPVRLIYQPVDLAALAGNLALPEARCMKSNMIGYGTSMVTQCLFSSPRSRSRGITSAPNFFRPSK